MSREPLLSLKGVGKSWQVGGGRVDVLKSLNVDVYTGESLAVVGPSGAGKSTLLHILGLLTTVSQGQVIFEGQILDPSRKGLYQQLRRRVGMIFQDAKLLPNLTVLENVCMPLAHRGVWPGRQVRLARSALERVGMGHREKHKPNQLSGGESMRVALARTIITEPTLLLADEPTGTLDSKNGEAVADLLFSQVNEHRALVLVTHHSPLAGRADRVITIVDGAIDRQSRSPLC